ncbi:hypothetical protein QE152_g31379 [Popillia japonica]|uniref:Uncharacterized protein n=1 Tax=Popillia japonica TaxID=7064 RepID=A0AAW1J1X7_POPJA
MCDMDNSTIVKNLFKDMPPQTSDFLASQLRCARHSTRGRRWLLHEKILVLAVYKRCPRCLGSAKAEDRMCIISFDEMDIKQHIQYDAADWIRRYEDLGAGAEDVYTPTLPWFNKLKFLDDVITPRKTISSYENSNEYHVSKDNSSALNIEKNPNRRVKKRKTEHDDLASNLNSAFKSFDRI